MQVTDQLSIVEFLKVFMVPDMIMLIGIGDIENPTTFKILFQSTNKPIRQKILDAIETATQEGLDCYFSPAVKKKRATTKSAFGASNVLWIDDDMATKERGKISLALPPSIQVTSGSGRHLYWILRDPIRDAETLEGLNQNLAHSITGNDKSAHNSNRWLRIPHTVHSIRGKKVGVESVEFNYTYEADDFYYIRDMFNNGFVTNLVNNGYKEEDDRSEVNWRATMEMLETGITPTTIEHMYRYTKLGQLLQGRADPRQYVKLTLQNALKKLEPPVRAAFTKAEVTAGSPGAVKTSNLSPKPKRAARSKTPNNPDAGMVVEGNTCYHRIMPKGEPKKVSNYLLTPLTRCIPHDPIREEDATVSNVVEYLEFELTPENGFKKTVMLNISDIRTYRQLNTILGSTRTTWMGNDADMQQLHDLWAKHDIPEVPLLTGSGFHHVNKTWVLASMTKVFAKGGKMTEEYRNLPDASENGPRVVIDFPVPSFDRAIMGEIVPKVRPPEEIWPLLGWFTSTALKPWILEKSMPGFPVLHVGGVSGAGKSTITRNILMPLFGLGADTLRDSNITWFVGAKAFSASTSYPLVFTEFRINQPDHRHLRTALLNVYTNARAERGNANKSIEKYNVSTPLVIDSEDAYEEGRMRDRMVTVDLKRITDVNYKEVLSELLRPDVQQSVKGFFSALQFWFLELLHEDEKYLEDVLATATGDISKLETGASDRVLSNHVLVLFGAYLYADFLQVLRPSPEHFRDTISMSFNKDMDRQLMDIDAMMYGLVMAFDASDPGLLIKIGSTSMNWNSQAGELSFPFRSAMSWWQLECFRLGKPALAATSLKKQLQTAEYFVRDDTAPNGAKVVVINIQEMSNIGLEVPTVLAGTPFIAPNVNLNGSG